MELKYEKEYGLLAVECPPSDHSQKEIDAFRFTFESIKHPDNFKPLIQRNPKKYNDVSDLKICGGYAISMFDSHASAKAFHSKFPLPSRRKIGTHLAIGKLDELDGLAGPIDKKGHYNFHESKAAQLESKFSIIAQLV